MLNMRRADPSRRLPTYLQPRTLENLVWQLKLLPVVFAGVLVYDYVMEKRDERQARKLTDTSE